MNRRRVDYVILYVSDLQRSIAFYRDVAGMAFKFADAGYAEFATEGTKFALCERALLPGLIGTEGVAGGPSGELAFLVEDVDAEAERVRGTSAAILSGPVDRP